MPCCRNADKQNHKVLFIVKSWLISSSPFSYMILNILIEIYFILRVFANVVTINFNIPSIRRKLAHQIQYNANTCIRLK
jgi:hypothetical protein